MITENQALASFDFLGTTGDSDSDEEEEEEEEEEEREDEEGDPTVAVDDEFTPGFVPGTIEGIYIYTCTNLYICVQLVLQLVCMSLSYHHVSEH